MKNALCLTTVLLVLLLAVPPLWAKSFGARLTQPQPTPLSAILAAPDDYVGKVVQVRGVVIDVCAKRGCWLAIAGDQPFEQLRLKVDDGEMVFPMTARGRVATVEGVLQKFVLNREEALARLEYRAKAYGEAFDPATVADGETFYQLRGLGAVIDGL